LENSNSKEKNNEEKFYDRVSSSATGICFADERFRGQAPKF
jgi:hypothetical protein